MNFSTANRVVAKLQLRFDVIATTQHAIIILVIILSRVLQDELYAASR